MKLALLLTTAAAFLSCTALADQGESFSFIKTMSGKVYTNCRIFKVDPDGVIIAHEHGGAKLLYADLPPDLRDALGYDPKRLEAYEKARAEQKKQEQEELWNYRREVVKAQAAIATAEARRLEVEALQNLAAGAYGGGYGYGWDPFGTFGYGLGYGFGGFGYGIPAFGTWNSHGHGHGHGHGHHGHGFNHASGNRFGGASFGHGFTTRGGFRFPTPANIGNVNVIGRSFCAPQRSIAPLATTPAMGPSTPSLGGGRR